MFVLMFQGSCKFTPCYKQFLLGLEEPKKSADAEKSATSRWFQICKSKNWVISSFWEKVIFLTFPHEKTTFQWPKVVSEAIFPTNRGYICIEKWSQIFVLGIGSAHSESEEKTLFKVTFSQNLLIARFWASGFWMSILSSANFKKDPPWYIFSLSVHAPATSGICFQRWKSFVSRVFYIVEIRSIEGGRQFSSRLEAWGGERHWGRDSSVVEEM